MSGADTLKAIEVMNPKRRDMARLEDDAEQRIAAALDKWRRDLTRGMTADNAPFIVSRLQQRDVYQPFYDAIIAVLRDLALAGAGFGREQIEQAIYGTRKGLFDVVWDLVNAAAERWAREFGGQLIRGITETTRQRVAATVADWTTNDEGIYALTQRLAEPNGPFGQSRARTIAVTETTRAYAEGNRAAWRESNVVTRRRWNTNVDEAVCPICGPLHNVVVGLDESYPGGLDGPPAHPNCRCWVTPVVPGAEERETGLEQFGLGRPADVGRVEQSGTPLSRLVTVDNDIYNHVGGTVDRVLKEIDTVHDVSGLPNLVVDTNTPLYANGVYRGDELKIGISLETGNDSDFVLAHEIGHFIDNHLPGAAGGFASENRAALEAWEELKQWRDAAENSTAIKRLRESFVSPRYMEYPGFGDSEPTRIYEEKRAIAYYLQPREIWARSYSQWVAKKSGSEKMIHEVSGRRKEPLYSDSQWDDDDFAPIASAMDAIFRSLGWLK